MQHELKQVEVRLKLTDKAGVFSMERIDTPKKRFLFWHQY